MQEEFARVIVKYNGDNPPLTVWGSRIREWNIIGEGRFYKDYQYANIALIPGDHMFDSEYPYTVAIYGYYKANGKMAAYAYNCGYGDTAID